MNRKDPRPMRSNRICAVLIVCFLFAAGCSHQGSSKVAQQLPRKGDEIVVCGQLYHTGAPVVLWMDPGGFDAYRTERRFAPYKEASFAATTQQAADIKQRTGKDSNFADLTAPQRLDLRSAVLSDEEIEKVRGGGWDLKTLQDKVDQF